MPVMTKPGTILLTCEPFVYAGAFSPDVEICDTCLYTNGVEAGGTPLKRCSSCHTVFYCNEACQLKGWKDGHKFECKGMKHAKTVLKMVFANEFPRLLLRTLVKLQDGEDHFDVVKTEKGEIKRKFQDLISHVTWNIYILADAEEIKKDQKMMKHVDQMISTAKFYLRFIPAKYNIEIPSDADLLKICGQILVNAFIISTPKTQLGAGVYLAGSICDHSCDPMAARGFEGTTMVIRNIKEIPAELPIDKVTMTYTDGIKPSNERRSKLKEKYYFDCQCDKCTKGLFDKEMRSVICSNNGCKNEIATEDLRNPCGSCGNKMTEKEVDDILKVEKVAKKTQKTNPEKFFLVFNTVLDLLEQANFSEGHWLSLKFYLQAFEIHAGLMQWGKAYDYGSKYLSGIRRYLQPNDQNIGSASARLADVALFLNKIDEAEAHKNRAKAVLKISDGVNSHSYKNLIPPLERKIEQAKFMKGMGIPARFGV